MKRTQVPGDSSPSLAQKKPRLGEHISFLENFLRFLPDDEFKLILNYVGVEGKKNLKLTSKSNEKRVMRLDPFMRSWKIQFSNDNWTNRSVLPVYDNKTGKPVEMSLSKARIRHILDGTFEDIKLSLDLSRLGSKDLFYNIMLLTDNVLNHWRDNIVHLELNLYGLEFFLLDPKLKMPQLKSLTLINRENSIYCKSVPDSCDKVEERDVSRIANELLEKQRDTLEILELKNLPLVISVQLHLKEFKVANNTTIESIVSVLKSSQLTLEKLDIRRLESLGKKYVFNCNELDEIRALKLNLKEFKAAHTDPNLVVSVIKKSQYSLMCLELESINFNDSYFRNSYLVDSDDSDKEDSGKQDSGKEDSKLDLGEISLELTRFSALAVASKLVTTIIRASQNSLQILKLQVCRINKDDESICQGIKLKLKSMYADRIPATFITSLLLSSTTSLEDMSLKSLDKTEEGCIVQLKDKEFKNLKKFSLQSISTKFSSAILDGCQTSLRYLELIDMSRNTNATQLAIESLPQLKQLKCKNIPLTETVSLIKASLSTLENLEINQSCCYQDVDQPLDNLKLRKFSCSNIRPTFAASIILSSRATLEHLTLNEIVLEKKQGVFNLGSSKLDLKTFTAKSIPSCIVKSVLHSSPTMFHRIELKWIGINERSSFDPEMTRLFLKAKAVNPCCVINI